MPGQALPMSSWHSRQQFAVFKFVMKLGRSPSLAIAFSIKFGSVAEVLIDFNCDPRFIYISVIKFGVPVVPSHSEHISIDSLKRLLPGLAVVVP